MKIIDHPKNSAWWKNKIGNAGCQTIADFAKEYQLIDPNAHMVVVTEGETYIAADHVRSVIAQTRAEGAQCVWVSDGRFAQCVWRK